MSYQVLARKWRPANFRQMVGQEHVLRALINALDQDRLHHAYLFTGTRGVGKTTIARILAKCLNCETGVSSEPCGECGACREIAEGRSVDLLEVDAASRTKVEDTRELLENVQYAPTNSRYKVYLIDEVHMLSSHSFNALLKTLEEPPPHVKFLLATTDPQKLPATILSRCLQFNLKNMPAELVVAHLKHVLEAELVDFEEPALWLLGRAAAGSMRDALSLTDQAIAFGQGRLLEADVRNMLGSVDLSFVYQLLEAIASGDPAAPLAVVNHMAEHGPDYEAMLDELISLIHRVALAQAVPNAIDNSWGDAERVRELAAQFSAEDAQLFYQVALNGKRDLPYASDPRGGLEMVLLRMVAFRPAAVLDEHAVGASLEAVAPEGDDTVKKPRPAQAEPVSQPESAAAIEPSAAPETVAPETAAPDGNAARVEVDEPGESIPVLAQLKPAHWYNLLDKLSLNGLVHNIAAHCELIAVEQQALSFVLDERNSALYADAQREQLQAALSDFFDSAVTAHIELGQPPGETPAMRKERLRRERQQQAVDAIESDPLVQQLIERFDGELDRESIAPIQH